MSAAGGAAPVKLWSHLVALTLVSLLPVALLAALLGSFLIQQQRETFRRGTEERVLAISTAVDSELKGSIDTLRALAHVRTLDEGDLRLFRESAAQILATQEHWLTINLALPDGQQVMNTRVPEGVALPKFQQGEGTLLQLARSLKPVVDDMVIGRVSGRWDFGVRMPVVRDGKLLYVLTAVVNPDSIARLVNAQGLPADWIGTVLDRSGRTVARTVNAKTSVGQMPSEELRQALAGSVSGWFRGRTPEGREVYRAYRRSDETGWTFAMAIPVAAVEATANRAIWIFGLALAGALALAVGLAQFVGRRIAGPIAALASATDRLAMGEDVEVRESGRISELRSLEKALRNAAGAQAALRRAEEQTRSVVDHVLDGIITIDERGTIESFNRAAERLFGYAASEAIGQNIRVLMPQPYRAEHDGYIANYLRTGEAKVIGVGREVAGQRKDGSTFPMDLAVSEFHLGPRRFFTGIVRDITERRRVEEALRDADRHKDEFLAMLGHELRNPLAALTTAAHVLRAAKPGDEVAAGAQGIIERQTRHMGRLIEDLLDLTRVRLGKLSLRREALDLAELVSQVVQSWGAAGALAGRATVSLDLAPVWINGDRARLEQILSNLLDNALKFTPASGTIKVSVRQHGEKAMLRVEDNGRGIARESLSRVFDPFVQGEPSLDRSKGGLGFGLALVRRLTELHEGSVSAESAGIGHGAVFTAWFPAVAASQSHAAGTLRR
jgi:PAS domain S-box-containing protein